MRNEEDKRGEVTTVVAGGGGRRKLRTLVAWFRLVVEGRDGGRWREDVDIQRRAEDKDAVDP